MNNSWFELSIKLGKKGALAALMLLSFCLQAEATRSAQDSELSTFFSREIVPHLPSDVLARVRVAEFRYHVGSSPLGDSQAGLFIPDAELPNTGIPSTEAPPLLHIYVRKDLLKSENGSQVLVHELFHAIHYLVYPNEAVWIREGLAQYFEKIVLGRLNGLHVAAGLKSLGSPLWAEIQPHSVDPAVYGHSLLYFHYLFNQCGGEELFWDLVRGKRIDEALQLRAKRLPCESFEQSVLHFEIARLQNRPDYSQNYSQNYSMSRASQLHQLMATTLPPAEPMKSFEWKKWKTLERGAPLLLDASVRIPAAVTQEATVFALERVFPYRVLEGVVPVPNSEESPAHWAVFILKK